MAQLTPGFTFITGHFAQVEDFHDYVDNSFLVNVAQSDLAGSGAARLIYRSTPISPVDGDVRVGTDGRLEFFFSSVWNQQDEDAVFLQMENLSSNDRELGDVIQADNLQPYAFTDNALRVNRYPYGVLAEDIAQNGVGLVCIRGICLAQVTGGPAGGIRPGAQLTWTVFPGFVSFDPRPADAPVYNEPVFGRTLVPITHLGASSALKLIRLGR